jgi:hypothetical protein
MKLADPPGRPPEDTITKLAQRHAAEKEIVRDVALRYEWAPTAAARAKESLEVAEAERVACSLSGRRRPAGEPNAMASTPV